MAHDVFISYSQKDKLTADALCATLEKHQIRCWVAPRDILPGILWEDAIVDAVSQARVMVVVLSDNANVSEHVINEVRVAVSRGIAILPFRIEEVVLCKRLELYWGSTPPAWGSTTPARWWKPWAARSASSARWGKAAPSGSLCRWWREAGRKPYRD